MTKNIRKKLLSIFFALMMIITLLPATNNRTYAEEECTVTYDANGADNDPDLTSLNTSYQKAEQVTIANGAALTKNGMAFSSWNTKERA